MNAAADGITLTGACVRVRSVAFTGKPALVMWYATIGIAVGAFSAAITLAASASLPAAMENATVAPPVCSRWRPLAAAAVTEVTLTSAAALLVVSATALLNADVAVTLKVGMVNFANVMLDVTTALTAVTVGGVVIGGGGLGGGGLDGGGLGGGEGGMFDTAMAPVQAAERHSSHTTTLVVGPELAKTATLPMQPVTLSFTRLVVTGTSKPEDAYAMDTQSDVPASHHALLRTAGTTELHTAAAVNTPPVGTTNCCTTVVALVVQYTSMPWVSEYGSHGRGSLKCGGAGGGGDGGGAHGNGELGLGMHLYCRSGEGVTDP